jgi:hypothetical protein
MNLYDGLMVFPSWHSVKENQQKLPPLQGEGWGGDGGISDTKTHPHPSLPLEGEGTASLILRAFKIDLSAMMVFPNLVLIGFQ